MRTRQTIAATVNLLLFLGLADGAGAASHPAAGAGPDDLVARGRALVAAGECGRCHEATGLQAVVPEPRERSCAGCHAWVRATAADPVARAAARREFPRWDRYERNVHSFLSVPDLGVSGARLDAAWIARFLRAPYDVRPHLPESMIRTRLSEEDARAVAHYLVAGGRAGRSPSALATAAAAIPVSNRPEDIAAGAALFTRHGCGQCHAQGGRPAVVAMPGAPDLVHARDRMQPAALAAFIADPAAFGAGARMPQPALSATEAARIRDFLLVPPVHAQAPTALPADLPVLSRPVSYAEVRREVLDVTCIHCHMNAARNQGDGGPGNTGGLTWQGVGLDLESWQGVRRGTRREGRWTSILAPAEDGAEPLLLARLRARAAERAREQTTVLTSALTTPPGMPLGLPPVSPRQLQLVRTWLAQGAPGPDGRAAVKPAEGRAATTRGRLPAPAAIVAGAKKVAEQAAPYKATYRKLPYPGGDVPETEGVCTDVIVRAFRHAGVDLQVEVHEDAGRAPRSYPYIKKRDHNIDHRRVKNLLPYFERHYRRLPAGAPLEPGDIVFMDTMPSKPGTDHVGIVADQKGKSGHWLIVNAWTDGYRAGVMDLLAFVPVTHAYRAEPAPRSGAGARTPAGARARETRR